jgi:hypothetical protein
VKEVIEDFEVLDLRVKDGSDSNGVAQQYYMLSRGNSLIQKLQERLEGHRTRLAG